MDQPDKNANEEIQFRFKDFSVFLDLCLRTEIA